MNKCYFLILFLSALPLYSTDPTEKENETPAQPSKPLTGKTAGKYSISGKKSEDQNLEKKSFQFMWQNYTQWRLNLKREGYIPENSDEIS